MIQFYTNKQRKALFDKINNLSSTEHEEILKIIKSHNVSYSRNKNGVFFNLSSLEDNVIDDIDRFVTYCMSNKKDLDEYDKIINECKMNNCIDSILPTISDITAFPGAEFTGTDDCCTNVVGKACLVKTSLGMMGKAQVPVQPVSKIDDIVVDKFIKFADKFTQEKDKIGRKKLNLKFNNAKKRFSKKNERKIDNENISDILVEEAYLIT
jgi:hypothetical protein